MSNSKPRIFYWLGGWWCCDISEESWESNDYIKTTPSQHPHGSTTPKEAYLKWHKDTHRITIWGKIKNWFKGYFV